MKPNLADRGWARFPTDPAVAAWAAAARAAVMPGLAHAPRDCDGTWIVGVDALPNDASGAVSGGPPLSGRALDCAQAQAHAPRPLHRAQVSVTFPGYPRPRAGEGQAASGYRARRDGAHLDGLLPVGPARRRKLRETHAFVLGLPLTPADAGAAPLVVWEGSHHLMRAALAPLLLPHPPARWPDIDLTEAYHAARRAVFARCRRIELPALPGEATLLHRLSLHGVAPWSSGARAAPEGRAIAYFRPELSHLRDWIALP